MLNDFLAVIVLYKEMLECSLTFNSLNLALKGFDEPLDLVIYDNSPISLNGRLNTPVFNITYISDETNSGISKAYNTASKLALQKGKKWLLLLDQDSNLPGTFMFNLIENIRKNKDDVIFAPVLKQDNVILSPCRFNFMKGSAFRAMKSGRLQLNNVSVLNSGMCVNLHAFNEVGGYNEHIKLDFSDHAFIRRIKTKYKSIIVTEAIIEHQLSSNSLNEEVIYNRFVQYCKGIKAYSETEQKTSLLLFWTALRALKLSLWYKSYNYLKVFFNLI